VEFQHHQNPIRKRAWFQLLKLKCDYLLSNFTFNFKLCRYTSEPYDPLSDAHDARFLGRAVQVDPIKHTLKAPSSMLLKLITNGPVSNFAFDVNLRRYTSATI